MLSQLSSWHVKSTKNVRLIGNLFNDLAYLFQSRIDLTLWSFLKVIFDILVADNGFQLLFYESDFTSGLKDFVSCEKETDYKQTPCFHSELSNHKTSFYDFKWLSCSDTLLVLSICNWENLLKRFRLIKNTPFISY